MATMSVRGISLFVEVIGQGVPLLLMHGGPGADHASMLAFRPCADQFTLVFYDHRCNGRSVGPPVSSMTWENLTADADALRQALGFDTWAVLGHSFGGMVALEYALRYPHSLSHLLLLDTCADAWWVRENTPELLARRGYSPSTVDTARRFYTGRIEPDRFMRAMIKLSRAYYHNPSLRVMAREILTVGMRTKARPEAQVFAFGHLLDGWTVMDRLAEIQVPTLVLAGRSDFQFPPEHQAILADRLPDARLVLIERAGHNAPTERPAQIIQAVRDFMAAIDARGA